MISLMAIYLKKQQAKSAGESPLHQRSIGSVFIQSEFLFSLFCFLDSTLMVVLCAGVGCC